MAQSNADERPLEVESDGLLMWLDGDVSPLEAHSVIEYLNDRDMLNERGEDFYTVFWESWIKEDD